MQPYRKSGKIHTEIQSTDLQKHRQFKGTKIIISTNCAGISGCSHSKQINTGTDLKLFTKINPKWIIDLNVKYKAAKLLKDKRTESLGDVELKKLLTD